MPSGFFGGLARDIMLTFATVDSVDDSPTVNVQLSPTFTSPTILNKLKFYLGTSGSVVLVLGLVYVSYSRYPSPA